MIWVARLAIISIITACYAIPMFIVTVLLRSAAPYIGGFWTGVMVLSCVPAFIVLAAECVLLGRAAWDTFEAM